MKLGLINSAWVQSGRGTAFGIRKTKEIGFDSIDIFADPLDIDVDEKKLIMSECRKASLPIVSLACVAVGLIDFNPSVQKFHLDRAHAYLDMAFLFEAKNVLLVLGEYIWQKEVIPPEEQWRTAVKHVQTLGEHADRARPRNRTRARAVRTFALERRGEHGGVLGRSRPPVREGEPRYLPPRTGTPARRLDRKVGRIKWLMFISLIATARCTATCLRVAAWSTFRLISKPSSSLDIPDATISIELEYSPEPDRIVEWVTEAYEKTASLMRAAGIARLRSDSESLRRRCSLPRTGSRRGLAGARDRAGGFAGTCRARRTRCPPPERPSTAHPGPNRSANPGTRAARPPSPSKAPSSSSKPRRSHSPLVSCWHFSCSGPTLSEEDCSWR